MRQPPLFVGAIFALACRATATVAEFQPNLGQADSDALFVARIENTAAFVEDRSLSFFSPSAKVRLTWVSSQSPAPGDWASAEPTTHSYYYCNTGNRDLCRKRVPGYLRLERKELFPGVDWLVYFRDKRLEYDLVVHPDASLKSIRLRVEGAQAYIDATGTLHAGQIRHWRPQAYQQVDGRKVPVAADVQPLGAGEFGFALGPHRADLDVVIDPVIETVHVAGGKDEDKTIGVIGGPEAGAVFNYGTTSSGDWTKGTGPRGRDIFVQYGNTTKSTIFWGGEGDEEIGGADWDSVNHRLYLAGWTNSQDALTLSPYDQRPRAYAGGSSDGFVLEVSRGALSFASYFGGPGADKLHDIRRVKPPGAPELLYAVSGETDDVAWPRAKFRRAGPGGGVDAIAAVIDGNNIDLTVIGGSGEDRAQRLRAIDDKFWTIGGETTSPDFPSDGSRSAAGRDLWIGRLSRETLEMSTARLFGGSGTERFGGLGAIAGEGLYLAGTTDSADLPAAATAFNGATDGFVVHLDPENATPRTTTYIGGSGEDEIVAMEAQDGDLFLGGSTNSPSLSTPEPTAAPAGGRDGLFVLCDAFAGPMRAIRIGGAQDDRVLGIQPLALGRVALAGSSDSRDWLRSFDERAPERSGLDGFLATVMFAAHRVFNSPGTASPFTPSQSSVILGRDLFAYLQLRAVSEPGLDGLLVVRSTDPNKLLVSTQSEIPGNQQIVLADVDSENVPTTLVLQALSSEGEVDVLIGGRSTASYPSRRFRVRLAPSALFFSSRDEVHTAVNSTVQVTFFSAPLLPNGSPGELQRPRPGAAGAVTIVSSDPEGLAPPRETVTANDQFSVYARREGTYTLTLASSRIPPAPGNLTVRVRSTQAQPFSTRPIRLAKDHILFVTVAGLPGDTMRFTSEDPSRLRLGPTGTTASREVVEFSFTNANSNQALWLAAFDREGTTAVRAQGTFNGRPFEERLQIQLLPYSAKITGVVESIGVGKSIFVRLETALQTADAGPPSFMAPNPALFSGWRMTSSDPSILEPLPLSSEPLRFTFVGRKIGSATLGFGPSAPPELTALRAQVEVATPYIDFGSEIVSIAGTAQWLFARTNAGVETMAQARLRLSDGAPFSFDSGVQQLTDIPYNPAGMRLSAANAKPGQQAVLNITAPGMPDISVRIRAVEGVFVPTTDELRAVIQQNPNEGSGALTYRLQAYESGRIFDVPYIQAPTKDFTVPLVFSPPICQAPEVRAGSNLLIGLRCTATGTTTVTLRPTPGFNSNQPEYPVRVIVQPPAIPSLNLSPRVLTGTGVQSHYYLVPEKPGSRSFIGTLTSGDPNRVRLSLDPKLRGSERVTIAADRPQAFVYVQGLASEGIVPLIAEGVNGERQEIAVHLFPSTLAVRALPGGFLDARQQALAASLDQPVTARDLTLLAVPYLVEPATGSLIPSQILSVGGGTDPAILKGQTSDAKVAEPVPPDALLSEGDESSRLLFRVNATGTAALSVTQPAGFTTAPDSAITVRVFERELTVGATLLSANLQVQTAVWAASGPEDRDVTATITSLDPGKLVISSSATVLGQSSLSARLGEPIYLQALETVSPGERVRVRLEAPGYLTSERETPIVPAELQRASPDSNVRMPPGVSGDYLQLVYGSLNQDGRVFSANSSLRPQIRYVLQVSSSDPSIVEATRPSVGLGSNVAIPLRSLRPGTAEIRIAAPPEIVNRAERVEVIVNPFQFFSPTLVEPPTTFLVSSFRVRNPRSQPTTLALTSTGEKPLRFGTTAQGSGAPSANTLTVTLGPSEERTLYLEPAAAPGVARIRMNAPDFATTEESIFPGVPQVTFAAVNQAVNLTVGTIAIPIALGSESPQRDLPLGASAGPLRIQLSSSNPSVVRVPAAPVEIAAGESRKSVTLQLVGRGEAIVTLTPPAGFNTGAPSRALLITVR